MNGAHDMGGMHGMGPIDADPDDPPFHAEWERRAFAVTLALGFHGRWNIDTSRHVRENRPPPEYLGSSYYELWFKAAEKLALDTGLITAEELATIEGRSAPELVRAVSDANEEAAESGVAKIVAIPAEAKVSLARNAKGEFVREVARTWA